MNSSYTTSRGICYEVIGSGIPLIMLDGIADSKEGWIDYGYVDELKESHQLVLIDFRGRGESIRKYDSESYSLDILADDIQSVVDHLELFEFDLLGYSMGGVIAHWFSKIYPGKIRSMVSLDGIVIADLVGIYHWWSENIEGMLEEYANDPRNSDAKKNKIMNEDKKSLKALSQGLSQSISGNLSEFLALPVPEYPYLVLSSNWDNTALDVKDYIEWAMAETTFKKYPDFDHADFAHKSDIVLRDLDAFYDGIE